MRPGKGWRAAFRATNRQQPGTARDTASNFIDQEGIL